MRKQLLCGFVFVTFLTGCTAITPEQQRAAQRQTCRDYGFRDGTDAFANCGMQLDRDRRAERFSYTPPYYTPPPIIIYHRRSMWSDW